MNFIDRTYFVNNIYLPQANNNILQASVDSAISIYEPEILKSLLGYELYMLVQSAWDDANLEVDPVSLPEKYDRLINGAEFQFELRGKTINTKWYGLINSNKSSLIADYVYFNYRNNNETRVTSTGEAKAKKDNSSIVSPYWRLERVWNDMIDKYGEIPKCSISYEVLKEIYLDNGNYEHRFISPSAYNFLLANISDYPEWVFEPKPKMHFI